MKYFRDNTGYPRISRDNYSEGIVLVNFVINTEGTVTDIDVIKSSGDTHLDKEVVRVIKRMPKWQPGGNYINNISTPIEKYFTLLVNFKNNDFSISFELLDGINKFNTIAKDIISKKRIKIQKIAPEYPGKLEALCQYISDNFNYPQKCREKNVIKKASVDFIVDPDGSVRDAKIANTSGNKTLDSELIRVINAMPKWQPREFKIILDNRFTTHIVEAQFTIDFEFNYKRIIVSEIAEHIFQYNIIFNNDTTTFKEAKILKDNYYEIEVDNLPDDVTLQYTGKIETTQGEVPFFSSEFPSGMKALRKYLKDNIKYPKKCLKKNIEGEVTVKFVINTYGVVTNVETIKSSGNIQLDNEVVRVVKNMEEWKPKIGASKVIESYFTLFVTFKDKKVIIGNE